MVSQFNVEMTLESTSIYKVIYNYVSLGTLTRLLFRFSESNIPFFLRLDQILKLIINKFNIVNFLILHDLVYGVLYLRTRLVII